MLALSVVMGGCVDGASATCDPAQTKRGDINTTATTSQ